MKEASSESDSHHSDHSDGGMPAAAPAPPPAIDSSDEISGSQDIIRTQLGISSNQDLAVAGAGPTYAPSFGASLATWNRLVFIPEIAFSYRGSHGVGKGALECNPVRSRCRGAQTIVNMQSELM